MGEVDPAGDAVRFQQFDEVLVEADLVRDGTCEEVPVCAVDLAGGRQVRVRLDLLRSGNC